ncbi:ATPase (plasmid) [Aminobacter sp. MSH1]|uniref:SRPBCC domain-containing protein n=1 Tax=Aminobacter sp. MSH1 TaxID=374606 RepID=UPI000D50470F|nr:SRPBCC domain-containing protein [Aminobacter sp. MSH1]ARD70039.2 ATPase [Aminobacter sp. MSH1]
MTRPRVDRAEQTISASADAVFDALTDATAVATWMPPGNARGEMHEFEPRPGGPFRMTLHFQEETAPKGKSTETSDTVDAKFVQLERGRLVEFAVRFVSDDPAFSGTMTMIWTLRAGGPGRTQVSVEARNVPRGVSAKDHANGLSQTLNNLSRWCTGSPADWHQHTI